MDAKTEAFIKGLTAEHAEFLTEKTHYNQQMGIEDPFLDCVKKMRELYRNGYRLTLDNLRFVTYLNKRWFDDVNTPKVWHEVLDKPWGVR